MEEKYISTGEVSRRLNRKIGTILKWARNNNIPHEGEGKGKRYLWTEKTIFVYEKYLSEIKPGKNFSKNLQKTENLDTLYHRLIRSKKNGNIEQYNQTRKLLDELKEKKNKK